MAIDENRLKSQVIAHLRRVRVLDSTSILASEFVLGQTGCRADLAIWNGKRFIGIEVKSARDSLLRLPAQLAAYRNVFDDVIVVCDRTHFAKASVMCDENTSLYVWDRRSIIVEHQASTRGRPDRQTLIKALTVKQLQSCLGSRNSDRLLRKEAERELMVDGSIDVRSIFINGFRSTYWPSSAVFWQAVAGKRVAPSHLELLSRFAEIRADARYAQQVRADFWRDWSRQAEAAFG
ncbi:sce7726 family protein [Rhizobium sp. Rhizsp82]|uniref:sce7726 family protein n=1 Tax=Rhizobium sp. Rhizsp82 TaxID=3243057 RepID=UPI0039B6CFD1